MRLMRIGVLVGLGVAHLYGQATCVSFPAGFVPFSSIAYVTAADSTGDHLVVGVPAPGALNFIAANIVPPAFTNQTFCDARVQLAPQQAYPNVYVPTPAEVSGNFSAFSGLLTIPGTTSPYAGGVIPSSQLGSVFAWRIGPVHAASGNGGWSPTGLMTVPRAGHSALLLPSGKVLVVGNTADLYDPATGAFTPAGQAYGSATLLNDGRVLIVGGAAAELYDPSSGQFTPTGTPVQPHNEGHTATTLSDGRVLIVGGILQQLGNAVTNSGAEIYDPQTGMFTAAGQCLPIAGTIQQRC